MIFYSVTTSTTNAIKFFTGTASVIHAHTTAAGTVPKKPKPFRLPAIRAALPQAKLSLSEAGKKCRLCGHAQFVRDQLTGCLCLRSLCKSARAVKTPTGYTVSFGEGWTRSGIVTFLETVR